MFEHLRVDEDVKAFAQNILQQCQDKGFTHRQISYLVQYLNHITNKNIDRLKDMKFTANSETVQ